MRSKLDFGNSVSTSASLSYITGKMKMIGHCNGGWNTCMTFTNEGKLVIRLKVLMMACFEVNKQLTSADINKCPTSMPLGHATYGVSAMCSAITADIHWATKGPAACVPVTAIVAADVLELPAADSVVALLETVGEVAVAAEGDSGDFSPAFEAEVPD